MAQGGWMTAGLALQDLDAATRGSVERTFKTLRERGIEPVFVRDRKEALAKVFEMIPRRAAVAHGTSTTLEEIGFGARARDPASGYRYLNDEWRAENDAAKQRRLRVKLSLEADVFLGSVQAISETGEAIGADASGSRQAFHVYGPARVTWVAGINKLMPTLDDALRRVREVALPQEDARMKREEASGSHIGKLVIYERECTGRITRILVGKSLGF